VTLLDTGSTPAVRSLAARQLAQIAGMRVGRGDGALAGTSSSSAAARANLAAASSSADTSCAYRGTEGEWIEALHLLHRIMPLLRSNSWETRIAAGSAIELICAACGVWDPLAAELVDEKKDFSAAAPVTPPADLMTFAAFSPQGVLRRGEKLLSSAGSEYDASSSLSVAERLASAKQDMKKLGLGAMAGEDLDLGLDVEQELMSEASTSLKAEQKPPAAPSPMSPPAPSAPTDEIDLSKLSARERNQLKRKRKIAPGGSSQDLAPRAPESKTRVLDAASSTSASSPSGGMRTQTASWSGKMASPKAEDGPVDHAALATSEQEWPFDLFSKVLLADLFAPKWEVRHGAALGLRSLLSTQGSCGGMSSSPSVSREGNVQLHAAWCADMSIRLLAVLCLDRLGDFVFDQVVTPVRETAAQALASLLKSMPEAEALKTHAALVEMVRQDWVVTEAGQQADIKPSSGLAACRRYKGYAWEVRHAGLLGLKWLLSVRADLLLSSSDAMSDEKSSAQPTALLRDSVELAILK
jgi:TATA-binding protein-associated factor